jgi:hypothetical protein
MRELDSRFNLAWWTLRLTIGAGMVLAGADKYFNKLTDWTMYLNPMATQLLPVSATGLMRAVGVVEIVAGMLVLLHWTRLGSYFIMAWLLSIAANLVLTGMFYDLAARDVELAAAAFVLSQLTVFRQQLLLGPPPVVQPVEVQ